MTQDEIIALAREAGFVVEETDEGFVAKLCHPTPKASGLYRMLNGFANLVAEATKEKAAKEADYYANNSTTAKQIAAAIRSMK